LDKAFPFILGLGLPRDVASKILLKYKTCGFLHLLLKGSKPADQPAFTYHVLDANGICLRPSVTYLKN